MPNSSLRQSSFFHHWTGSGFFSEHNHMLLGILYCLSMDRRFVLSSKYSPYLSPGGWQTFFTPFCTEMESMVLHYLDRHYRKSPLTPLELVRRLRRLLLSRVVQPAFFPNFELMVIEWEKLCALKYRSKIEISINGVKRHWALQEALRAINSSVWRYNAETEAKIRSSIERLELPARYAAIHVRRGNKYLEAKPADEITYVSRLEEVSSLQDVYVATDDYRCIENIRRLRPEWRIAGLCAGGTRGWFIGEFLAKSTEQNLAASMLLLTETEIMKSAEVFVGTFSSGVGTFQGIAREAHSYGVDFDRWNFEGEEQAP